MQLVSDIVGIELAIPQQLIGASYGDAFMAAVGAGLFKDLTEITRWVKNKKVVSPNPEVYKQYALNYKIFRDLYTATQSLMHELSDSQKT
jgi:xylulokinase